MFCNIPRIKRESAVTICTENSTDNISFQVVNIHSIRPLDEKILLDILHKYHTIVTIEEHSVIGGLGSAVAEFIAEHHTLVNFKRIGLKDHFVRGYGKHDEVKKKNALDTGSIYTQIKSILKI